MNDNVTFERLQDIIAETLKVDKEQVTAEASFQDDLKADSLDLVELIMAFEDEYGVECPTKTRRRSAPLVKRWSTSRRTASNPPLGAQLAGRRLLRSPLVHPALVATRQASGR